MDDLTTALPQLGDGADADTARQLLPLLYDELRALAEHQFGRRRPGDTLQPTVLVHEALLKLLKDPAGHYADRKHFFAVAAIAMRQVLVNHARARAAGKRGGGARPCALDESAVGVDGEPQVDVLDLHEALEQLRQIDQRKHQVVELRFFAGLSVPEVAEVLDLSVTTIEGEWRGARAWLLARLADADRETSRVTSGGRPPASGAK